MKQDTLHTDLQHWLHRHGEQSSDGLTFTYRDNVFDIYIDYTRGKWHLKARVFDNLVLERYGGRERYRDNGLVSRLKDLMRERQAA